MNQLRPSQLADAVRATARAIGDDLTRVDRTLDRTGS
jgi:hypothetical protein